MENEGYPGSRTERIIFRYVVLKCEAAGDAIPPNNEVIESLIHLVRVMVDPPRNLSMKDRALVRDFLKAFHVTDWPTDHAKRQQRIERIVARYDAESALEQRDPSHLIPRPKDSDGWERIVDRWLARQRQLQQ
jgi:hypothetical protein